MPLDSALAKARRRILPFVFLLYIVAFLDRANVAFAKVAMSASLNFSEAAFGFGAGVFFIGYFLFEIPGALIVERWSARKWLARILVTWGICTVVVGFVRTPTEFYTARFLLGCAEAGFFPGVIVYLTHWFPTPIRARAVAGLIMAVPVSQILGGPISGLILKLDWAGLEGWRWVFILEGVPAVILGFVTLRYLTDRPAQAAWLTVEERDALTAALQHDARRTVHMPVLQVFRQPLILLLAAAMASANIGTYAFQLWLPSLLGAAGQLTTSMAAAFTAIPFACALIGMRISSVSSDRTGERRYHAAIPLCLAGVFFFLAGLPNQPFLLVLLELSLAGLVAFAWPPPFWAIPTSTLGPTAAAASVGFINSIGNLGGFIGPFLIGLILSAGYSLTTGITLVAAGFFTSGLLILAVRPAK